MTREITVRKLIAGLKVTVDGKIEGADGTADWVEAWSEDYGLTDQIDACLIGGTMYPGYENYWTSIRDSPATPAWITGKSPTSAEIEWAGFASRTPHYVLSTKLSSARWPNTQFLRRPAEVKALKQQRGKDIYLMGGAQTTASLIDAGMVDELRLIVYPVVAGKGKALFARSEGRHKLDLQSVTPRPSGLVSLIYRVQ
jgi:dihydrofolate reductase